MVLVSLICLFSFLAIIWIRTIAVNFLSTFFALSSGARRVEEWMEEDLLGGVLLGLRFLAVGAVAVLPMLIVKLLGGTPYWTLFTGLISFAVFFPVVFLSTLETEFPVMPITRVVFRSFFRRFGTWFFFDLWTAVLLVLPLWGIGTLTHGTIQILCSLAAVMLIPPVYSVLLGRLGWVIEDMTRT